MFTWFWQLLGGIAGMVLLYYGAEFLIRGGVNVARKFGVSPLVIGLTLVAFGTSAPELVVSIAAALQDSGDIAVGNVVGSNICNIALILGLCALLKPIAVNEKLFTLDMPLLAGVSLLFVLFYYTDGRGINRWQGGVFLVIIAVYLWWLFRKGGDEETEEAAEEGGKPVALWVAFLFVVGGLIGLAAGARLFVDSAVYFAKLLKVPEAVIALTVVALGTSLPELATSVVAVLKNEKDIAVGNIVGSNIFNILVIMGIAPLVRPLAAPGVKLVDLLLMAACVALLWPMMLTGKRISRGEGAVLLLVYVGYVVWLYLGKNITM